jgi:transcriptional regulator with XRE-family HTH domain
MKRSRQKVAQKHELDLGAVGRRIRELRGFEMTQKEFARRIGVAQSHLSALEHGQREPGSGVLLAISREFGKSVDWLLTGEEKK